MLTKEAFQSFLYEAIPLIGKLGITIESLDGESVKTVLKEDAFNKNHFNSVYAGIQFTVMEVTGGILFAAAFDVQKYFIVVKDMSITYHKPAYGDMMCSSYFSKEQRQELLSNLEADGKAQFTLPIELKNSEGVTVSSAAATYFISPQKKK